jgi:hypothetical protein
MRRVGDGLRRAALEYYVIDASKPGHGCQFRKRTKSLLAALFTLYSFSLAGILLRMKTGGLNTVSCSG